jgi:hypothetical protein
MGGLFGGRGLGICAVVGSRSRSMASPSFPSVLTPASFLGAFWFFGGMFPRDRLHFGDTDSSVYMSRNFIL